MCFSLFSKWAVVNKMINIIKENLNTLFTILINNPIAFLLVILCILVCIALAILTLYMVGKFEVLQYPFVLFVGFLIANFYIEILLRVFKLFN